MSWWRRDRNRRREAADANDERQGWDAERAQHRRSLYERLGSELWPDEDSGVAEDDPDEAGWDPSGCAEEQQLTDDDWVAIDALLVAQSPGSSTEGPSGSDSSLAGVSDGKGLLVQLADWLQRLRVASGAEVLPAVAVTDLLLGLWGPAHRLGPAVARPAEELMSALVGRHLATATEVRSVCKRTEAFLALYH
ncbi:MAG TPA: hypothetical protein VE990_10630 [Acidimicrobiales bacterium]|nr:hypothetical protein [Acidimicrobiales bacterium]